VAVIGSGLAAVGAVKALVKLGVKPTVLDWGERLDPERSAMMDALARKDPREWSPEERDRLSNNPTLSDRSSIPKKLVLGSDFFYGKSRAEAPVRNEGGIPPFSYALGGLSAGWGAAILPPQACDLNDWPVDFEELNKYCAIVLADLPYSAANDGLSLNFPLLAANPAALQRNRADMSLLGALDKASLLKKDSLVFGEARLLVRSSSSNGRSGCQYCGHCMSGCVYKSIYKAGDEISDLREKGYIDYKSGCLVDRLSEQRETVQVSYFDATGKTTTDEFDRVILAAGAVNTTRIVLNSLGKFNEEVRLKTRGGFVMPVMSLRRLPIDWPECNTLPGIFLELKGKGLKHWVHVQISTSNELLFQRLKIKMNARSAFDRIKRFLMEHVLLSFVNYHSDHAGHYKLRITPSTGTINTHCLYSEYKKALPSLTVLLASGFKLLKTFLRIRCLPLFPFARFNSGTYHVGGTLPMKTQPSDSLETDELGRVSAWSHVHIVDTSIFPSLPGTTIGLLIMANAYRIVDKMQWDDDPAQH
jgi:GMC oxidoreductase